MGPNLAEGTIVLFYMIFLLSLFSAAFFGGAPERVGAATLVLAFIAQAAWYSVTPPQYADVDPASVLADFICLLGFGYLALNSNRIWPICIAGFQVISLASHFARLLESEVNPIVYSALKSTPTSVGIIILLLGTIFHRRRLERLGEDNSWVDWEAIRRTQSGASIQRH